MNALCTNMFTENRNRMNRDEIENFLAIKDEVAAETAAIIDAGVFSFTLVIFLKVDIDSLL